MAQVITFTGYTPIARYDSLAWTAARIQEATLVAGPWTLIDTVALSPLDADPSDPAVRNLTTELASDTADLWYRIIFVDADGDTALPTTPVQNSADATPYATVDELARILKLNRQPLSDAQTAAMERVLSAAAGEINSEVDLASTADPLTGWQLALAAQVNLERAAELWQQQEIAFGIVGIGSEFGPTRIARDTWGKHAFTLAPLKGQFGLA